jgi:hypothetical protein
MRLFNLLLASVMLTVTSFTGTKPVKEYDLIVYGGTSSGVIAAYAAAKDGLKVAILEPNNHLGGLTSSGLGHVDIGNAETVGGFTMEFLKRVGAHYGTKRFCTEMESSVAEKVFSDMAKEAGISIFYKSRLQEKIGVKKTGNSIEKLILENGEVFKAKVFIDATYEGDLMAWAKVPYTVGRESKAEYGESSAGVQEYKWPAHQTKARLQEIKDLSTLFPLDYIFTETQERGTADKKVQAYTYRLCLTTKESNKLPFFKPVNYRPERYRDLLNRINKQKLTRFDQVTTVYPMPNDKADINHLDLVNASWNYPDGTYKEREYIDNYHKDYEQGFLYFLANDPGLPAALRKDAKRYGFANDEFADNNNWPYLLYVREGRRMQGSYVMKQQDAWDNVMKKDGIGIGSYFMDCHTVQQIITSNGLQTQEGEMEHAPFKPYEISYGSLTPKETDCDNLLVTVCLSASHTIYGSLRMEPVFMITGHAAGLAASMAVSHQKAVQQIDVDKLRDKLSSQGQILKYATKPGFFLEKDIYDGYVMDDTDAEMKGDWLHSISTAPFLLYNYQFALQSPVETASATYQPKFTDDGLYEVQLMYSADKNRSKKAKVLIKCEEGERILQVDMTKKEPDASQWHSLGTFKFSKNNNAKVIISNQGDGGVVVADGLRFNKK